MIAIHGGKSRVPGISMTCAALLLLSGIWAGGHHGLAIAADITAMDCNKEIAKTMVQGTAAGLGEALAGIKTEKDRIDLIRAFISPIRFYPDKSGYFYVYDFSCINIAHATQKELQGKNLYDYKDAKGGYVIRTLSDAAKKGGGFVEFYWVKPDSRDQVKKLGYVAPIPGTNYFIGSGVYLNDLVNTKESLGYYPGECSDFSSLSPKEKELVEFVCKAKAFAFANMNKMGVQQGLAATFKEFQRQAGDPECKIGKCPFQKGELYMFAYENEMRDGRTVKVNCRAHGAQPAMVGKDFFHAGYAMEAYPQYGIKKQQDAKFFQMISDAAFRKSGHADGFVLFTWPNPVDGNKIWLKKSYSTKITDTVWIGSGIHIEKVQTAQ